LLARHAKPDHCERGGRAMARRVYAPTAGAGCTIWPARRPPSGEDGGTSNRAGERRETSLPGRATTSVANGGLATLPTLDLLLRIAQDATATPVERLKAASEAARFLLPKKPGPKKSRRGKFPPDEYGFSVDRIWRGNCGMRNCS